MKDKYGFPNTQNSMIDRIQEGDEETRRVALEQFANSYRVPLMNYLVKCLRIDLDEAEDLVQQFFLEKIMNGKVLGLANGKGRFRNALKACLSNFFKDKLRANKDDSNQQRLDGFDVGSKVEGEETASDQPIEMIWVTTLFRTALLRLKNESQFWGIFYDRELADPHLPYDEIIKRYGLYAEGSVATSTQSEEERKKQAKRTATNQLQTAKRQFDRLLTEGLATQTYLSGTFEEAEYDKEIKLLKELVDDKKRVYEIVKKLDDSCIPESPHAAIYQHSIVGEQVVFMNTSPDESWDKNDSNAMLRHLMSDPVCTYISPNSDAIDRTIGTLLFQDSRDTDAVAESKALKEYFNAQSKSKTSSLPQRVLVTMTFTMIARFVSLGGAVEDITSMRRDVLTERLEQLIERSWIPEEIRELIGQAIARLLA